MPNHKGFMFTIDALMAIVIVASLAAAFMAYYGVIGAESHALQMHEKLSGDDAMLGAYGIAPPHECAQISGGFGSKNYYFKYGVAGGVEQKSACREGFDYE